MNYREKLYSNYVLNSVGRGSIKLDDIKKQFAVWKRYYGKFFPKEKNAAILDIGCGNGGFIYFLQTLGFKNVQGIDLSKEQVELARKLGIDNILQYDVKHFLLEKQEIYDVIFARDVMEHFTKDEILKILNIIFSSLIKGGKVVIQCPNGESPFAGRIRYGDFTHEMAFTKNSLYQILSAVGFKYIDFYPTGPVPKGLASIVRYLIWKCIEIVSRSYLFIETGYLSGIFTQNIIAVARKNK